MVAAFRLGLIGAGRMGRTHLRALAGSSRVTVTAIAEMSGAARDAVASLGVPVYPSVAAMLDRGSLDGVLIVAPTDQHGTIIGEVAERGVPILCEKLCGLTAASARASASSAAAAGVPLQVAYWRRFVPGLQELRSRIAAGSLGAIHLVTCYQWDEAPPTAAFRAHSGGIAVDMGVHEFDQLRWLTGRDIEGAAAVSVPTPGGVADVDSAQVIISLSGGATGFVSLGRYYPAGDAVWAEAFGTGGSERRDVIDPAEGERAQLGALRRQAESFASFASGGACEGATAADAIAALAAAELVSSRIPALSGSVASDELGVGAGLPPSYRHRPGG